MKINSKNFSKNFQKFLSKFSNFFQIFFSFFMSCAKTGNKNKKHFRSAPKHRHSSHPLIRISRLDGLRVTGIFSLKHICSLKTVGPHLSRRTFIRTNLVNTIKMFADYAWQRQACAKQVWKANTSDRKVPRHCTSTLRREITKI